MPIVGNNILFVDMTVPFLPVISAVAQQGFTPFLIGPFTERVRQVGVNCHDLFEFAPDDLKEQAAGKVAEISSGLAEAVGAPAVKEVISSPFGNFWYHTGVDFFNRFLEVAADEIEIAICFEALVKNNDLDLVVFRTEKMPFERTLIRLAARQGIPTLHVAHALWGRVKGGNIAGEYGRGLDSDYISVFGKRAFDGIVNCGIDPDRVFIAGSPYWDELYSERNQMDRKEACRRLQLNPDHPVILFCTGYAHANSSTYPIQYNDLMEDHKAVMRAIKELDTESQLIVRYHPTELNDAHATDQEKRAAVSAYKSWLKREGVHHVLISNDHKIESFKAADAAIIFRGSNVIVDSMILQCPVIALRSGGLFNKDGICVAKNLEDLPALTKNIIDDPSRREEIIQAQNKALPDLNFGNDGKARERIAELIIRLAGESRVGKQKKPDASQAQEQPEVATKQADEQRDQVLVSGLIPTTRAIIDINRACNARCLMCYHAYDQSNWAKPLEEVKQELSNARHRGNTSVDFTGGEPTIYPQMVEAIGYAESIGLHTCIITNGISLEKIKPIVEAGCKEWLVSIHGYERQQDKILGVKGAWDKINTTVKYLTQNDCFVRVNCTLTKYNYKDLPKLARYYIESVEPRIVNFINFNPHYSWGNQGQPEIYERLNQVQVKVSDVAPYLMEALDILNSHNLWANVRYFPFCLLQGYETHICNNPQVMFDPYEWDYGIAPKTVEIYQAYGKSLQERIGFKGGTCRQCGVINVCGGIHKNYEKFHGSSELTSYVDQSDYPYHFKTDVEADIIIPAFKPNENLQRLFLEIGEKTVPPYNLIVVSRHQSAAKNRNYGMERSNSPYVIMCDDDIKDLPFAWNRQLINLLKENRDILAASARLMNPDGSPGRNSANDYDLGQPIVKVDMIPTACSVFRKTDVRFDERFIRAGWEDTDFFWQLKEKYGNTFAITNTVRVVHLNEEKESGGAGNIFNQHIFFEKWQQNPPNVGATFDSQDALSRAEEDYKKIELIIKRGQDKEAISRLEILLETCPDFAPGRNRLGALHLKQGNLEQSLNHLRRAADLEPMNPEFQKDLADLYRNALGRVEDATKIYIKVLAIHPTHIQTLLAMGHVCREVEKPDDAGYFFGRVLEIEPWNIEARENLDEFSA